MDGTTNVALSLYENAAHSRPLFCQPGPQAYQSQSIPAIPRHQIPLGTRSDAPFGVQLKSWKKDVMTWCGGLWGDLAKANKTLILVIAIVLLILGV